MERNQLRPILREKFPPERTYLLPALHYLQHELGHLPEWALQTVAWHLRVPASEVYGAATSYSELRIEPPGQHVVRVCTGLACWTNGGQEIAQWLIEHLGIAEFGQTSQGSAVTLEETHCGFVCPMAPAVEVDGRWHGRLGVLDMPQLTGGLS